jgi:hypothetical protein
MCATGGLTQKQSLRGLLLMHQYPVAQTDILPFVKGIIPFGNNRDLLPSPSGLPLLKDSVIRSASQQVIHALLDHNLEKQLTGQAFFGFKNLCDIQKITAQYRRLYAGKK